MDYTIVRGTLKSTLSPNDKQTFKEKLKVKNNDIYLFIFYSLFKYYLFIYLLTLQ